MVHYSMLYGMILYYVTNYLATRLPDCMAVSHRLTWQCWIRYLPEPLQLSRRLLLCCIFRDRIDSLHRSERHCRLSPVTYSGLPDSVVMNSFMRRAAMNRKWTPKQHEMYDARAIRTMNTDVQ